MSTATRLFDDFQIGDLWQSPPVVVTADEIVAYAREFDPQPMHTDPVRAAAGPFKALIASGWHIASISMREFHRAGGYGTTPTVGLGIDELRWQRPVRAGDTITVSREVVELRRSASSPGHGIVRTRVTVRNQAGETAMSFLSSARVPCREGAPAPGAAL